MSCCVCWELSSYSSFLTFVGNSCLKLNTLLFYPIFYDRVQGKNKLKYLLKIFHTECVRALDKVRMVKLCTGVSVLGSSQLLLLLQLPPKMDARFKGGQK